MDCINDVYLVVEGDEVLAGFEVQAGKEGIACVGIQHHGAAGQKPFLDSQETDIFSAAGEQLVGLVRGEFARGDMRIRGLLGEQGGSEMLILGGEVPHNDQLPVAVILARGHQQIAILRKMHVVDRLVVGELS